MGGAVSARAEVTDKNPPRLDRYDRWGHDISEVVLPPSFLESRRDVLDNGFNQPDAAAAARGIDTTMLNAATATCSTRPRSAWRARHRRRHGGQPRPPVRADDIREHAGEVRAREWAGETIQSLTERTGWSDLAEIETTATPDGDAWRLNGFKWFAPNANGQAWVVLAKPEGVSDNRRASRRSSCCACAAMARATASASAG